VTALPRIGAPATRALASIGVETLEQVAGRSAADLQALHGFGPKAVRLLAEALASAGLEPLT
jgi:predicted flap endonuclease-1-like 5' DNA nuclease